MTRPREHRLGTIVHTPIPAPSVHIQRSITTRSKILSRDRLVKLAPSTNRTSIALERNQKQCTFLHLPAEIRSKIYAIALGNCYLRIEYQPHVHRTRQQNGQRFKEHIVGGLWCHIHELPPGTDMIPDIGSRSRPSLRNCKLTLPSRTCRQMYADTALLHFELNIFSFNNSWVMRKWMLQLKPVQKRALRRLDLSRTNGIGITLGKQLTGLQRVWSDNVWKNGQRYLDLERQRKADEKDIPS